MNIENNSELYFKRLSNKNNNKIFTESKTRFTENTNFVYKGVINTITIKKHSIYGIRDRKRIKKEKKFNNARIIVNVWKKRKIKLTK